MGSSQLPPGGYQFTAQCKKQLGMCDSRICHGGDTQKGKSQGAQPDVAVALPTLCSVSATWVPQLYTRARSWLALGRVPLKAEVYHDWGNTVPQHFLYHI